MTSIKENRIYEIKRDAVKLTLWTLVSDNMPAMITASASSLKPILPNTIFMKVLKAALKYLSIKKKSLPLLFNRIF